MSAIPIRSVVARAVVLTWELLDELVSQTLFVKVITYSTDLAAGVAAQVIATAPCDVLKLYYSLILTVQPSCTATRSGS